jgi:hypothetical protein
MGDLLAWLAFIVATGALVFSGLQFRESRKQGEQTEKALRANTAAVIYQEDRDVWERVTPTIYDYFHGSPAPRGSGGVAKRARIVAGAMLDHFEHVRVQIARGTFEADTASWDAYISETFENSPLLCQQLEQNAEFYGGAGAGTVGDWATRCHD